MIHCDKCKTVNPPEQRYCQTCQRDLLPGTGFLTRFFGFLFSMAVAAAAGWVLWRMTQAEQLPDLGCFLSSPIWWGLLAVISPVTGFIFLVKRTPIHERYLERGKRHLTLDENQALADFNEAVRLAPEKARPPILKERAKLLEKRGLNQQAHRDKIAVSEAPDAHEGAGTLASMVGANKDMFMHDLQKKDREALQASGAVAVGYCRGCRAPVALNEKSRCPRHPRQRVEDIRLAVPEDIEDVKASMMEKRRRDQRKRLFGWIVFILGLLLLYLTFKYIILV